MNWFTGYITSTQVKDGKMPEKAVYTLTDSGNSQFENDTNLTV